MLNLEIEHRSTCELRPYSRNARTHSPKQIAEIAASIKAFGFNNPVLIDKNDGIVAGHGRVEAAKHLDLATVPTIRLEHLSDAQKRAYILADNKLAEKAGWDREILAIELQNLMEFELDFDISATGFEMPEIDVLISDLEDKPQKADPADAVPDVTGPAVTRLAQLLQLVPQLTSYAMIETSSDPSGIDKLLAVVKTKHKCAHGVLEGGRVQIPRHHKLVGLNAFGFQPVDAAAGAVGFPGVWRSYSGPIKKDGPNVSQEVFAFMTTEPNALTASINHERMPVLLSSDVGKPWCGHDGFYVDDKALRPDEFLHLSYQEVVKLLKLGTPTDGQ